MRTVTGNTFPVKDQLKSLGGKYNPIAKGWDMPDAQYDAAKKLVGMLQPQQQRCAECGRGGSLVRDLEDGLMKHYGCCDMPD